MTKEELRKIFEDFADSSKLPPSNPEQLAIRANQILNREILIEVLAKILADK